MLRLWFPPTKVSSPVGLLLVSALVEELRLMVCDWPPPAVMPDRLIVSGPEFSRIGVKGGGAIVTVGATV